MPELPKTLDDMMTRTVTRNLLKYAAGRTMFCPRCQTVMDCTRTVIVDYGAGSVVCCSSCYDKRKQAMHDAAASKGVTLDITDGRVWFAKAPRKPRKQAAK